MTTAPGPQPEHRPEHHKVLIIGAGLSGIDAAYHVGEEFGTDSYAVLEARQALGGTWDLFRYPGVRSDSDMYTLGYPFKPWTSANMIGSGPQIRDYIEHTGAVAVLAVREDRGEPEVLVLRQYRHPIGAEDWELPAGLLDVEGEDPVTTAQRELAEEADLQAGVWEELLSFTPSPGSLGEVITVFVATGLSDLPEDERHEREHEEAGMPTGWVGLDDLVAAVLGGQVRNGPLMLAALALDRTRCVAD